mgnify:CR=1
MSHIVTPDKIHRRQQKAAEELHWELLDRLIHIFKKNVDKKGMW